MVQPDRREFIADLDAMQESRVREKLLLGHYVGWQEKTVERWLREREEKRSEERARRAFASDQRTAFWTRGRALLSGALAAAAAVAHYFSGRG